jgi:WD40 repeat protein
MQIACAHCHSQIDVGPDGTSEVICPTCGSSFCLRDVARTTTALESQTLGRFQLLERVGAGAFGVVWKARDTELDRIVALKLLHTGRSSDAERERFFREARAVAQLRHPGIVAVYEVTELDGSPAIVSEFIAGVPLSDLLQVRRPSFREAAHLIAQVADALDYAHSLRVVHRDVKPANVMIERSGGEGLASTSSTSPRALLVDFGLALRDQAEVTLTMEGQVIGTPAYMSPEQAAGLSHRVDRRTDVYSLGVVLYELLCGEIPFRGSKGMLIQQLLHEEPRPPRRINDKVPRDLETICLKAMAKEPARRYATAGELAADLRRFLSGEAILARPAPARERLWRWVRRHPAAAGLLVVSTLAVLALVAAGVGSVYSARLAAAYQETEQARQAEAEQRRNAEQYLYFSRMALAEREWSANNVVQALRLLDDCPDGLRGWEWRFLKRQCHTEIRTLPAHSTQVSAVASTADGLLLASGSFDRTIKFWNPLTGQELFRLNSPQPVYCVELSRDGKWLASGDSSGDFEAPVSVRVWDVAGRKEHWTLKAGTSCILSVAFDSAGRRLAAAGWDKQVRIWDLDTGRELQRFSSQTEPFGSVAFSPDGRLLAAGQGDLDLLGSNRAPGSLVLWDLETGKQRAVLAGHTGPVNAVAFSADSSQLASASWDQTVKLWDVATARETHTLRSHTGYVTFVAYSRDGRLIASSSTDGSVKVWNPATGAQVRTLRGHRGPVTWLAFVAPGQRLASAGQDGTVRIWDPPLETQSRTLRISTNMVNSVAFGPKEDRLAVGSAGGLMKILDPSSGEEMQRLQGHSLRVWRLVFSPDGRRLASASEDKTARVWDSASGKSLLCLQGHAKWVQNVAFSADGLRLATASGDQTVKVWDAVTGQELLPLAGHTDRVWSVAFSPTENLLASAAADQTVRIWDARTGSEVWKLTGHGGEATSVAFSPDGKQLASAAEDGTLKIWDPGKGTESLALNGHSNPIYGLAYSPDGLRLASASLDGTIKVWDTVRGQEVMTLRADTGGFHSVAFSPDGQQIAGAGYDGTVRIWDATPRRE